MTDSMPETFLGLGGDDADYRRARYAILPIPYDATTSYAAGTRDGPRAIIAASRQLEDYDVELGRESYQAGIATLDPLEPDARGPEAMCRRIARAASRPLRDGKFLLALGGEHSITAGLVRAALKRYRKLAVLQIDAHADLRDRYHGSPYSHACVMRRIHDMGVAAVAVGVRSYSRQEAAFIRRQRKPVFAPRACREAGWIERVLDVLGDPVYITIDIDGFDPACAPGTGTPEPGGLDWFQVADLLAAVAARRRIVAADIVEVRPLGGQNVTEFLAARLAYRIIGLTARNR